MAAKRSVKTSKVSPEAITAKEKALKALAYRKEGLSFAKIAERLGYKSESGARNAVNRLLKKVEFEETAEYRKVKLLQLEDLYAIAYGEILGEKGVNLWALDRCQALIEQQAKLLGLYAAAQLDVSIRDWRKEFEEAGLDSEDLFTKFVEAAQRVEPEGD